MEDDEPVSKKYYIETVKVFRCTYVIEAYDIHSAIDAIDNEEVEDFSQHYIDENILTWRAVDDKEIVELFNFNNPNYDWTDEQKLATVQSIVED